MKSEITNRLEQLVFSHTNAFCYSCYRVVKASHCPACGSDDLMRELPGTGVEWGIDWAIKHILDSELIPVNIEENFEDFVRECYPETVKVGWMKLDSVDAMKNSDPIGWNCALSEYISQEEAEEVIVSFDGGSTYYKLEDIDHLCRKGE